MTHETLSGRQNVAMTWQEPEEPRNKEQQATESNIQGGVKHDTGDYIAAGHRSEHDNNGNVTSGALLT